MRTVVIIAATGLVFSLAACTAAPSTPTDCTTTPAGSASNSVTVTGELGSKPEISFTAPTDSVSTERTVVIVGDGELAVSGDTVAVDYVLLNGETGDEIAASEYVAGSAVDFPLDVVEFLPGIVKTLECSTVGSRVVGVIPPVDSFGDLGSEQLGLAAGEDLVFVADVISIAPPVTAPLPRADGQDQPATEGFPTVVLDGDGRPTVTIPDSSPPAELGVAVLKKGSGAVVEDGADVTVHYVGINWNTGVIFDESWARGEPATFNTGAVIAGFTAALVGQTVGSQVIVVIPPDQGYGAEGRAPDIGGTDTLIFVIDILGIA